MIYVLAYPEFAPSCADRIHEFRARHEPERAKLVPPHVTLVFGVGRQHLPVVTDLAEAAARETRAFEVSFDRYKIEFDPFDKKHKLFLLCSEGGDTVTALHNHLYDGDHRAEFSAAHPFQPHMTIASYGSRSEIERVNVEDAGALPLRGALRALQIVELSNGALSTRRTVPLAR